jgi:hypothetical protein
MDARVLAEMPALRSGSREMWRQAQTSFLATQTNTARRAARRCRQLLPQPRALETVDVVAAPTDDIPAQLHKPREQEGCCSAVVAMKVVAKLAAPLVLLQEIGSVVEARVESPPLRALIRPRLERGMSGSRFPKEEPPTRI